MSRRLDFAPVSADIEAFEARPLPQKTMEDSMSDQSNADDNAETPTSQGAEGEQAHASSLSQPSAESSINEPEPFTELENLYAENAGLKDRLLRAMAEIENVRRRAEREVADAKVYGVANFAREMLPFADNLRRAAESVPEEARERLDPIAAALMEGLRVTERDFLSRLGRFGVKPIEALGAKFDPNLHEALYEIPDETQPAGTVGQVIEQGYTIGERVLRPAKVGVTRGGPKG
jgi:molecular chaperone GrpE